MDEDRISGTAKNIGGKVEESFGRTTGDTKTQAEGIAKQVSGTAQDMYGQARDAASNMSDTARDTASSLAKCRTAVGAMLAGLARSFRTSARHWSSKSPGCRMRVRR